MQIENRRMKNFHRKSDHKKVPTLKSRVTITLHVAALIVSLRETMRVAGGFMMLLKNAQTPFTPDAKASGYLHAAG
ncbi:MAG: hypothetical protein HY268_25150 [Deltaproteobacteria bacterium]|nr:hypothetical protein [Deltaproteobacteria bacterium]